MALALQWSLDRTADSSLSLSRGLIAAATSDNVEPLAMAACERFGTTLSICRDSCAKAERLVEQRKPVLTFLGAYIGYSANDCATQLVQSVAGVQFLALAGALVSSIGVYQGAEALEILLERSAVDKTQVPPVGKLRPLLKALEPRCTSLRFLDSVVYCRKLLVQSHQSASSTTFWNEATQFPNADGIAKLVLALFKIKASAPSSRLQIRAGKTAPWVVAFTAWILGSFPSIAFQNGQPLLKSPQQSRVMVVALEIFNMGLEISSVTDLGRPSDLIMSDASNGGWSGMVSVTAYGQSLRNELDMSSDGAIRCLTDTLPYAVYQCLALLRPSKDSQHRLHINGQHTSADYNPFSFHGSLASLSAIPFGQDANISKAISLILGISSEVPLIALKSLPNDVPFHDLPALQKYLKTLKRFCNCTRCNRNVFVSYEQCRAETFCRSIVALVTDILCLSFFENLDELCVSLHQDRGTRIKVSSGVFDLLTRGGHQSYDVLDFYDWALALVGHSEIHPGMTGDENENRLYSPRRRILSSMRGQVTYLKLFETRSVARRGYLTLAWARGLVGYYNMMVWNILLPWRPHQSFRIWNHLGLAQYPSRMATW